MSKPVILTGLRANSDFHLGNYLGAILPMVKLQKTYAGRYQVNMFVPDLHSFTTPIDHSRLYQQSLSNLKTYLAAGLNIDDPDTYIYRQSFIPAHSELTVVLNNFAYFGELSRMTQFKEKSENLKQKSVTAGLFDYPVLMAADILLYGAEWVPVGDDQQQHLEFTRNLGERFNHKFGEIFKLPRNVSEQLKFSDLHKGVRIRSLRNPEVKMSKSIDDTAGTIMLNDEPAAAAQKIMSATTDSVGSIKLDWEKQPGVSNLLQIEALLTNQALDQVVAAWKGQSHYGELKQRVAGEVKALLEKLQTEARDIDEQDIIEKLEKSERQVTAQANQTLAKIQKAVGLRP